MGISVVVLGNKPLTLKVAKFILYDPRFQLSGIIIGDNNSSSPSVTSLERFAKLNNVPCYDSEWLRHADAEKAIGLSIGYPRILTKDQIGAFDKLINLHFGELPWYRGSGTVSHAILNGEAIFGMTLHRIDEGVDTGPVYAIEYFPIQPKALASDIIKRGEVIGLQMVRERLAQICHGEIHEITQESLRRGHDRIPKQYYRKSLRALKVLDGLQAPDMLLRQYRAACLPGQPLPLIQVGSRHFTAQNVAELEGLITNFDPVRASSITIGANSGSRSS